MEQVNKAHLAVLSEGRNCLTLAAKGEEHGRRRGVEIPKILMHQLEAPTDGAGFAV
jgi:hypothetical protein